MNVTKPYKSKLDYKIRRQDDGDPVLALEISRTSYRPFSPLPATKKLVSKNSC